MLNIPPLSPNPSTFGNRRRGGQPSNRNALKHGYFAVHNPTPFTPHLDPIQSGPLLSRRTPLPALYARAIQSIRRQIALTFDAASHATGFNSILTWQRALLRHLALFLRYRKALARYQQPKFHLQLVASHPLALIRHDFQENGIPLDTHSFRGTLELSDFNSPSSQDPNIILSDYSSRENLKLSDFNSTASDHPFITSYQWALLEPLLRDPKLPSPSGLVPDRARVPGRVEESGEAPSKGLRERSRRGRPTSNPRPLLNAIFWKIAHHARWQDLPAGSPPMLTCRRYYRHIYLGGYLFPLYTALYRISSPTPVPTSQPWSPRAHSPSPAPPCPSLPLHPTPGKPAPHCCSCSSPTNPSVASSAKLLPKPLRSFPLLTSESCIIQPDQHLTTADPDF